MGCQAGVQSRATGGREVGGHGDSKRHADLLFKDHQAEQLLGKDPWPALVCD